MDFSKRLENLLGSVLIMQIENYIKNYHNEKKCCSWKLENEYNS